MAKTNKTNNVAIELNAETVALLEQIIAQYKANQTVSEPKKATASKSAKASAKAVESKPAKSEPKATKSAKSESKPSKTTGKVYWQRNAEHKGIEVVFTDKPSAEVRESLKKGGFRWHNAKKLWFAKDTDATQKLAVAICGGVAK